MNYAPTILTSSGGIFNAKNVLINSDSPQKTNAQKTEKIKQKILPTKKKKNKSRSLSHTFLIDKRKIMSNSDIW